MTDVERKSIWVAAGVGIAVMVACGAAYRIASTYLARPASGEPMTNEQLNRLPMDLDGWRGREIPMDDAVIKATATDAHLSRVYTTGLEAATLFVGAGIKTHDLVPHRPKVCYREAGWGAPLADDSAEIDLPDGSTLPCRIYRFQRGGMQTATVTVLNYYIVDGSYSPDVSLLRSKAWRGSGGIAYMAQVQILCSNDRADEASQTVRQFAAAAAVPIRNLMPDRISDDAASPDQPPATTEPEGAGQ